MGEAAIGELNAVLKANSPLSTWEQGRFVRMVSRVASSTIAARSDCGDRRAFYGACGDNGRACVNGRARRDRPM